MYGRRNGMEFSSFEVVDKVIRALQDSKTNPNLEEIVLVGHGGGAQFVHRFAVVSDAESTERVKITYMVANPSTFLYLTQDRPLLANDAGELVKGGCDQYDALTYTPGTFSFEVPDMARVANFLLKEMWKFGGRKYTEDKCAKFDKYEYGLTGLDGAKAALFRERFRSRNVVYVAARFDACNLPLQEDLFYKNGAGRCGFCCHIPQVAPPDFTCVYNEHEVKYPLITKCQAMMQGHTRVQRAYAYRDYLTFLYGDNHSQVFLPVEGQHSSCEIFQSGDGQAILFGTGPLPTPKAPVTTTTTSTTTAEPKFVEVKDKIGGCRGYEIVNSTRRYVPISTAQTCREALKVLGKQAGTYTQFASVASGYPQGCYAYEGAYPFSYGAGYYFNEDSEANDANWSYGSAIVCTLLENNTDAGESVEDMNAAAYKKEAEELEHIAAVAAAEAESAKMAVYETVEETAAEESIEEEQFDADIDSTAPGTANTITATVDAEEEVPSLEDGGAELIVSPDE
jgi:hypothetical protein